MALFDLLGRTWAMGIVWQLSDGPTTFRGLQARCDHMSASLLNRRLKDFRTTGLVARTDAGYALTPLGEELAAHLKVMGAWSLRWAEALERNDEPAPPK